MRYQRWSSKIILFALTAIFTFIWELIFIPVLLPQADAQDNYNPGKITQNHLNPQNLLEKGKQLYHAGNFPEAILVLEKAAQIFESQGNQFQQAISLSNISLAYKKIGEYQQALNYITQSRKLLENQLNSGKSKKTLKVLAQVLDIQANLELTLGKSLAALETWKEATAIYERVNLKDDKTRSLINQNLALQALGRYRQARNILERLLPEIKKQPASLIKAIVFRNLGDVQLYLGEIDASIETLKQSYEIAKEIKSTPEIARTLLSLGNAQRAKANKLRLPSQTSTIFEKTTPLVYVTKPISQEIRELYQQAIQTYENTVAISTSPVITVKAQLNLLNILIELQEFSKANNLYSQLQLTINKLPVSKTSINARINLAKNLLCLKQVSPKNAPEWQDIAQILAAAIKQAEDLQYSRSQSYAMGVLASVYLQNQSLTDALKLTEKALNLALRAEAKDIAYLWQWQLGYIFKVRENTTKAIDYYSQAVSNLNNLRGDLLVLNPDLQFSFRDDVEPVYRQLVDLLLQPSSSENISQTNLNQNNLNKTVDKTVNQKKLKQARDVIEALQLREIENYFQEVCLQAKPKIIDTVVDTTDTTAAVIYPIILQDRLEIILKLPNQDQFKRYTTVIGANQVEEILQKLQDNLRHPDKTKQVKEISAEVYSWLIQPLEADLEKNQIQTLVFVLDGSLRNIPMAVLYDKKGTEEQSQYLIEKYAIVLTPGLQMLEPKPLQQTNINALIAGLSEKRLVGNQEFNSLEHVQIELQTIKSQIPNSKKLLNQSFTDKNLEKQINSGKYTVVHIATHGNFSSNLEETYILTWNTLLKVKDFGQLFQTNANTDSQAIQLLVLSACETADGDKRATLGLSGIAVRAGARSTLATLWAVEDESTAELMSQFYQELQKNRLNKAKALQQAQIKLLKSRKSPKIWAPYVLVGNWL